jgi:hypothetical protein
MASTEVPVRRAGKLTKLLRRVHLYTGLIMLPWLLLFGISGLLFNHPNVGEDVRGERIDSAQLQELTGFSPWSAERAAARVVQALNASEHATSTGPYVRDESFETEFSGFSVFSAKAPQGQYMLLLDVQQGQGVLATRAARPAPEGATFPELQLQLDDFSTSHIEQQLQGLLRARGLPGVEQLRAHPKIAPELRLRARDRHGVSWNLTYDTRTGSLSGRKSDAFPNLGFGQLLAKLHTTHHFPLRVGSLWFWALFEDLLGLSMVLWALTGMVMWWKIKPTRLVGALSFALALSIAVAVMGGTLQQLVFGNVRAPQGPGE